MEKLKLIYEGKAKKLYETEDKDLLIQEFKDDATAFDAAKRGTIMNKGVINNKLSAHIFTILSKKGIPTHFVKRLNDREMLVKKVQIVPIEVTMRNIVAGGMAKLLGLEEGKELKEPVLEWHYKEDALHDPLINDYHVKALGAATDKELEAMKKYSFKINELMKKFFDSKNIMLVDFKLEFGRYKGKIILADEISPDTCRLWDKTTKEKLDKDRFRRDLGNVEGAYEEVLRRVMG
ncbi:MAG: phosphoribosylaminoimidazolesuccinocarboxamide synthase [Omnitrophica bacterium RIFCSPLOWO2_02_FULL_45_16]|nr:MAG: phosphoribosylaminoimidazolesuccinocarboxamide synthase [Omnitrophica bacterium RIFCSPLOWO2_12_FULL_45_13]OGW94746.1 MAG: phosphoribosylaminoimidazolesuccinocarboxamide synthase [Omnitrophica bacterium RIFCSPLOWO2_01_FULL_45_24]OGX01071.1 MAG: phosphoribosylaminoimidazolesuccinocarboxamide synthase [Omnitrophica bacterium RIFCSPLOWO2_02_FULL_45_16]